MLDAAVGEIKFETAINALVQRFDAAGGVIFELNRKTGTIENWIGPGLEAGAQDYIDHLHSINPRMRYSLRHAPGHVAYEGLFTTESAMNRSEFYDALMHLDGFGYFLGSRLYDEGDVSVFHSIEFEARSGHPEKEKIEWFSRVSADLGKAWKLAKTQNTDLIARDEHIFLFEHLPWAVYLIDERHGMLPVNTSANDFLNTYDSLSLIEGKLITDNLRINDALVKISEDALAGKAQTVALPIGSKTDYWIVQTLPVPGKPEAYLFLRNPVRFSNYLETLAPKLFGLTKMESRVLAILSHSSNLNDIAEKLKISRNTVRNHLRRIYLKTGTKNRAELLMKVLVLIE